MHSHSILPPLGDRAVTFAGDLASGLTGLQAAIDARSKAAKAQLDAAAAAASSDQVDALTAAAKALLGTDFQIYPEWTMSAPHRPASGPTRWITPQAER